MRSYAGLAFAWWSQAARSASALLAIYTWKTLVLAAACSHVVGFQEASVIMTLGLATSRAAATEEVSMTRRTEGAPAASLSRFSVPCTAGVSMSFSLSLRWLLPMEPSRGEARWQTALTPSKALAAW